MKLELIITFVITINDGTEYTTIADKKQQLVQASWGRDVSVEKSDITYVVTTCEVQDQ